MGREPPRPGRAHRKLLPADGDEEQPHLQRLGTQPPTNGRMRRGPISVSSQRKLRDPADLELQPCSQCRDQSPGSVLASAPRSFYDESVEAPPRKDRSSSEPRCFHDEFEDELRTPPPGRSLGRNGQRKGPRAAAATPQQLPRRTGAGRATCAAMLLACALLSGAAFVLKLHPNASVVSSAMMPPPEPSPPSPPRSSNARPLLPRHRRPPRAPQPAPPPPAPPPWKIVIEWQLPPPPRPSPPPPLPPPWPPGPPPGGPPPPSPPPSPSPPRPPPPPSPPPLPPARPPPYQAWPGPLNRATCAAMLRDPKHVFRRMWTAQGWARMDASPPCWSVGRDAKHSQRPEQYFDDVLSGRFCSSNWYEGTPGTPHVGITGPEFADFDSYPALLGFDENIDQMCRAPGSSGGHAQECVKKGLNILSLFSEKVPYNTCRNFEWQVRSLSSS